MPHILAIDQGTTSTRAVVFDSQDARPIAAAQAELVQRFPRPGWVEHDPEEIFQAAVSVSREAIEKAHLRARDIACLGIANQRETAVLWERETGRPIANAIVWQCRRTAAMCRRLEAQGHAADIRTRTGLVLDPYFSATKLRWLLDGGPSDWPDRVRGRSELQRRAEAGELCFGTVDSWLLFRLTMGTPHPDPLPQGERGRWNGEGAPRLLRPAGASARGDTAVHATDVTNASRTMLLNIHDLQWDPALLSLFDIPEAVLPEVRPSAGDFGVVSPDVLGAEIPITGVAGDQHAALYGQACFEPGMTKCTYGTGAFVLSVTGSRPAMPPPSTRSARGRPTAPNRGKKGDPRSAELRVPSPSTVEGQSLPRAEAGGEGDRSWGSHGLLATLGWQAGSKRAYALEGSVFVAGASVQWLRDGLGIIRDAAEAGRLAESLDGNDGVYFVPAFVGLGAPHWDAGARGTITGLTRGAGRAHIARAALEATAYQVRDVVAAMDESARRSAPSQPVRADGGQTASEFLMQFQADILGRPVEVSAEPEASALGVAFLAGRGAGIWQSEREVASLWQSSRRYEPQMSEGRRLSLLAGWNDALRRARLMSH